MRKLILIIVAFISLSSVKGADFKKNEFLLSYGFITINEILGFEPLLSSSLSSLNQDTKLSGSTTAEYSYRMNKRIGLGGIVSYERAKSDFSDNYEIKDNFITVMPSLKINWLNKKYFDLYSKAAVGATFNLTKDSDNQKNNDLYFAFQASLLGIDIGRSICGFAELGVGQQGVVVVGVKTKF